MKVLLLSIISVLLAIITCFGISCYYSYFYPLDYKDSISAIAKSNDIEPELIASIINVESSYNPNSVSNKGAIGLMQILPTTAEWVCERLHIDFDEKELFNPAVNIQIGGYYIAYLIKYFKDENLAICAYNAGMGNVNRWLSSVEISSNGKELDNIPFKETENYLNLVLKNKKIYKNKF